MYIYIFIEVISLPPGYLQVAVLLLVSSVDE